MCDIHYDNDYLSCSLATKINFLYQNNDNEFTIPPGEIFFAVRIEAHFKIASFSN